MEKNSNLHRLNIENREFLAISGVSKVHSFDPKEIILETIQGLLSIKGDKLGIKHLDRKEGLIEIEGHVDAVIYPKSNNSGSKQSLFNKIFR